MWWKNTKMIIIIVVIILAILAIIGISLGVKYGGSKDTDKTTTSAMILDVLRK